MKNTAWTCASINAAVCASHPPRLFVQTTPRPNRPRLPTRSLPPSSRPLLSPKFAIANCQLSAVNSGQIQEVTSHPLLTLLAQVNPVHNQYDLLELSQLYLEVHGSAYWLLDFDPILNVPARIWILPAHLVSPRRDLASPRLVDYYEYRGQTTEKFPPERIIHFRFPDPRDPYTAGLSPLRACFDQAALTSEYAALKRSLYKNAGLPSALITPAEAIDHIERGRLEKEWHEKFQNGGHGQALIASAKLNITLLSQSLGDLAALADMKATKEDIANAFHVPLPFLTGDTNLANMQAADHLHKSLAILPRLRRRDEKLNEQLVPLFDPTGRLFFSTEDPTPQNQDFILRQETTDVRSGVRTINEVRASRGLPPVPWGDAPPTATVLRGAPEHRF
ncbi:MAG: phage portal protein [Gemmataceae bacterium]